MPTVQATPLDLACAALREDVVASICELSPEHAYVTHTGYPWNAEDVGWQLKCENLRDALRNASDSEQERKLQSIVRHMEAARTKYVQQKRSRWDGASIPSPWMEQELEEQELFEQQFHEEESAMLRAAAAPGQRQVTDYF